ncbi:MAG: hypothetical protein ACFKPT_08235 [Gloeotrichia echinulata GP01]
MISSLVFSPIFANCSFDKTPTVPIVIFELFVVAVFAGSLLFLSKIKDRIWLRFAIMAVGVLIFELFTAPMWNNHKMGQWAYLYHDVSWVLTIGWTSLIMIVVLLVDRLLPTVKEWKRFFLYLVILTFTIIWLEMLVVNIGIRSYSPEVQKAISGVFIWGVPIELLYYTPVFTGLIISFYKYWTFVIEDVPLVPLKRIKWLRDFIITFLGVFLLEVMVEPMVQNQKLPQWSYIFHDISFLITGMWIAIIAVTAILVGKFFSYFPMGYRFLVALSITTILAVPLESWLIVNGFRVYSASAQKFYLGVLIPGLNVPVEIAFAIPCYMALIIAFIRYWENLLDNSL